MYLSRVTAPSSEPVTLAEAKVQCLVSSDITDRDDQISNFLIPAARDRAEAQTGRALLTQTWDLYLNSFPPDSYIEIPKPPLVSITSLKYRDTLGVLQTWAAANYTVSAPAGPRCARGRITLAYGVTWPSTRGTADDVVIRFVCGATTEENIEPLIRQAILLDIGANFANLENLITGTIVAELPGGCRQIYWQCASHPTQRRWE